MSRLSDLSRRRRIGPRVEERVEPKPSLELEILREEIIREREQVKTLLHNLDELRGEYDQYRNRLNNIEKLLERVPSTRGLTSEEVRKIMREEKETFTLTVEKVREIIGQEMGRYTQKLNEVENLIKRPSSNPSLQKVSLKEVVGGRPFYQDKIYQWTTVAAGARGVVWRYRKEEPYWEKGESALIYYLGNTWFNNTHILWTIDQALKEKLQRQIAPVNAPLRLDPIPLIAKEEIAFEAVNESANPHKFEVLCDGLIVDEAIAEKIGVHYI